MTPEGNSRAWRAGRAGFASAFAVLVALAAHLAGGGSVPEVGPVVAVLALSWPVAMLLIGARPRLWRQALVIGGAQLALHGLFALGSMAVPLRTVDAMAGMHGMAPTASTMAMAMAGTGSSMWSWHVLAWLLTTAAWRWGEAALHELLDQLPQPRLVGAFAPVLLLPAPAVLGQPAEPVRPRPVLLAPQPRRGPPASV